MNFSEALILIKEGKCLTRSGWNGKSMFIYLDRDSIINANNPALAGKYQCGTRLNYMPRINIAFTWGDIAPWLASQYDLLAEDWDEFVE
jgi:hypothetical protein